MADRPFPLHPFAAFSSAYRGGAKGMKAGDRIRYKIDGRTGWCDEFMHDGDAFVCWDDGTYETVLWHHLEPAALSSPTEKEQP